MLSAAKRRSFRQTLEISKISSTFSEELRNVIADLKILIVCACHFQSQEKGRYKKLRNGQNCGEILLKKRFFALLFVHTYVVCLFILMDVVCSYLWFE